MRIPTALLLAFALLTVAFLPGRALEDSDEEEEKSKKNKLGPNPNGVPDAPSGPPPLKKKPPKSKTTASGSAGAGTQAKMWLRLQNMYRSKENIPALKWSDTLYKALKPHVDRWVSLGQCEGKHPFDGMTLQRYGQNAAWVNGNITKIEAAIVGAWYAQKGDYSAKTKNCTDDGADVCSSFTQLMWRASKYVACRADPCKSGAKKGENPRVIGMCWYVRPGNCNGKDYTKPPKESPCGPYLPPK